MRRFELPRRSKALVANRIATSTVDVLQIKQPVLNALKAPVVDTTSKATRKVDVLQIWAARAQCPNIHSLSDLFAIYMG